MRTTSKGSEIVNYYASTILTSNLSIIRLYNLGHCVRIFQYKAITAKGLKILLHFLFLEIFTGKIILKPYLVYLNDCFYSPAPTIVLMRLVIGILVTIGRIPTRLEHLGKFLVPLASFYF